MACKHCYKNTKGTAINGPKSIKANIGDVIGFSPTVKIGYSQGTEQFTVTSLKPFRVSAKSGLSYVDPSMWIDFHMERGTAIHYSMRPCLTS
jgi:hypothetical protein